MGRKIKIPVLALVFALIVIIAAIVIIVMGVSKKKNNNNKNAQTNTVVPELKPATDDIDIVPTMKDKISPDSLWCATFQLVWNDMKNEVVQKDVVFNPQVEIAENLNKESFTESMISPEYYYKVYGLKTLELKEKIENGIMEKFNQTSDILDKFDWDETALDDPNNPTTNRYFFYTMLYRNFEFVNQFDRLEKASFANKYEGIEYFGINAATNEIVGEQIDVLYYNSQDDFAVVLNTKENDEVILCKNPEGTTFEEIYSKMKEKEQNYSGNKNFEEIDEFKAPILNVNKLREYTEIQNKEFETANGVAIIAKAIQSIKLTLNEKGGEIKSEAAIDMIETTAVYDPDSEVKKPRYFYVDNAFAIFLKEKGKDVPYFAGRVEDITKLQ